ncbi:MAG: tetratricopeptide repeat protein [Deltaproteobacteria bacterium]|nr:tetratricopeptide repeat protein [Deltaproteobacteria bacterium]
MTLQLPADSCGARNDAARHRASRDARGHVLGAAATWICAILLPVVVSAQPAPAGPTPAGPSAAESGDRAVDPALPPPAAPRREAPTAPKQAKSGAPTGKVAVGTSGATAGLALNAITIRSLVMQNQFERALAVADAILARYPKDLEVQMQRARLLFWLGREKEAEEAAVAVYRADRHNHEALRLVGEIREKREDKPGAIRAYREAQLRGDGDIRIAWRLISLYLAIGKPELARDQIRPGMEVPDELQRQLVMSDRPWLVQGLLGLSLYRGDVWRRAQLSLGYSWSPQLSLVAGVYGEQRNITSTTDLGGVTSTTTRTDTGMGAWAQLFFQVSKLSGDVRLFVAPETGGFLPPIDGWASAAWNFGRFGIGLWGRYANFEVAPLWSIGPYVPIYLGRLTLKPGYLLVGRPGTLAGGGTQLGHTLFLRSRFDFDVSRALFAWLYWGQEVVFTNRTLSAPDESSVSLVLGYDHWFAHRFGVRVMATALQQLTLPDRWYDIAVMLRVRL